MSRWKIVSVTGVVVLALAGCQSTVAGQAGGTPVETSTSAADKPSSAAKTTSSPPAAPAGDGELTPTGTKLALGQAATVQYETESLSKETVKLAVTAVSVKKGAIADLKNFNLDAQTKVSEPYYVTMSFRNNGPKPMKPGGIFGLINAHNAAGDKLGRLSLIGEFKKCDGTVQDTLAVGASYTDCGVYVAPPGQGVTEVEFSFYLESKKTAVTWQNG
jgi:hypothetical protein